ncbi:phosphotransferase [Streptomyces sp. B93]|uniref:phosphotransferase n=1 Tax=Streptomyces sp. B93 TaxID=2824875 RepID=UPI0027E4399C|nr:phosphotransferase [Streptomyces sp. B93]
MAETGGDLSAVEGPLRGYHHDTYVFPLLEPLGGARSGRWKCREPRSDLLWFDRRCFDSEERLLQALVGRVSGIPDVIEAGGTRLQRFIEGRTLGALHPSGHRVPEALLDQIIALFGELVAISAETLLVKRRCVAEDRPRDGDTDGFLERLIRFTEERVYARNAETFSGLFDDLGVDGESFKRLRKHVLGLRERPFSFLHADLHRANFVVDPRKRLWTIDWELAMVGDPLYDLATHLHLMRYPADQEELVADRWSTAVEKVRPGASHGMAHDLPLLVGYKRAQSVFTDVIRTALSLADGPPPDWRRFAHAAAKLHGVLLAARAPLGLGAVPTPRGIVASLVRWHRGHGRGRGAAQRT